MLKLFKRITRRRTVKPKPQIITMFSNLSARNLKRGEPTHQEYFILKDDLWHPIEVQGSTVPPGSETPRSFRFSVLSWNIDFMRPEDEARMASALKHLRSLVSRQADPSVIMLNEMTEGDLTLIKQADWVRQDYNITDASTVHWASPAYGTTMLVHRSLPIKSVFHVHYERTGMQRDALCVDIALPQGQTLRVATSHLESLKRDPPLRPSQLTTAAKYLHEDGVYAGIIGGDFNAIEDFDRTLHVGNNLNDAYLESGGVEDAEEGMTWGQMAGRSQRQRFGLSRMDKIMFCGRVELVGFERFGMGVQVEDEGAAQQLLEGTDLERPWVTDHLGVKAQFRIESPETVGENRAGK